MRWKLLAAFAAAFTVVFAFIAFWVVHNASEVAQQRLTEQLLASAQGAATDLPRKAVAEVAALSADADPSESAAFRRLEDEVDSVQAIIPSISPYIYGEEDGQLEYLVGGDPFRDPVARTAPASTVAYMQRGLTTTTFEPENTDEYGTWISAYSPITGKDGTTIAVVGMDYPVTYVQEVQQLARERVFPVLAISYAALMLLVLLVSTLIVRPLRRLTRASGRIAEGEYDLDLSGITRGRFADEMSDLADAFRIMAGKVAARERTLSSQVKRLQVQIDAAKRDRSVKEITETDFFADLSAKADDLRARMHRQ